MAKNHFNICKYQKKFVTLQRNSNIVMEQYGQLIGELGQELGFSIENGCLTLHLGSNGSLRSDVRNIGNDMRRVIAREQL